MENNNLHKEFEVERIIIFSDAVFAIAITLLIIDVKFPDVSLHAQPINYREIFIPLILHICAFLLSFLIIGRSWWRHFQVCKYVVSYNNGMIFRNLLLLLFIVAMPFATSSLMSINYNDTDITMFSVGIGIYMAVALGLALIEWVYINYIFREVKELAIPHSEKQLEYLTKKARYSFVEIAVLIFVIVTTGLFSRWNATSLIIAVVLERLVARYYNRRLRKTKPQKL